MLLEGKRAVVTGAASGIGLAIAKRFSEEGAETVLVDINAEALERAKRNIPNSSGIICDVSREEDVKSLKEKAGDVTILVNNAGISRDSILIRARREDWERTISVNLTSVFLLSRAFARGMMRARYGKIINISSVIGLMGNIGQVAYSSSKAGIIGLTKSLAKELATRNVCVNAIAPGFIETPMTDTLSKDVIENYRKLIPLGRFGKPEDVANAALFLASSLSDYITGVVLRVDGGMVTGY
ncbi:beta-ketoacyl-ACP reductase [bacterium]|nr:beta-ketoacyl-ACP reductase [bacterium]